MSGSPHSPSSWTQSQMPEVGLRFVCSEMMSARLMFSSKVRHFCLQTQKIAPKVSAETIEAVLSEDNRSRVMKQLSKLKHRVSLTASCTEEAAVFIPLCRVHSRPSIIFTVRSTKLAKHRGEVSFPGGKRDLSDRDLVHTAVREMEEELGISEDRVDVWAALPPMPDRLGQVAITPVLGCIGDTDVASLDFNSQEVASVFILSLEHLCATKNQRYTTFRNKTRMPVFANGPHKVWGLSAIILDWTLLFLFPGHHQIKYRSGGHN